MHIFRVLYEYVVKITRMVNKISKSTQNDSCSDGNSI